MKDITTPFPSERQETLVRESDVTPDVSLSSLTTSGDSAFLSRPHSPPPSKKRPQNRCPGNSIKQESDA